MVQLNVNLSTLGFNEHIPLDNFLGSIGITLSIKYTDVALFKASLSKGFFSLT
ncbi:hypothetical protein D3C76_971010 [compost metagenome]